MATQFAEYPAVPVQRGFSWTGIFAGTFLFLAIESTFGILGRAVLGPVGTGIGVGGGIWMIILSIIAMYFAGRLAGKLTGATTRNAGMYAGLITFGMSIFATVFITVMVLGVTTAVPAGMNATRMTDMLAGSGWYFFITFILAMISAGIGGTYGLQRGLRVKSSTTTTATTPEERRAA